MATKNQQISLKAIFVLTTFLCVTLYLVFAQRYYFGFDSIAAPNIVEFHTSAQAAEAIGLTLSFQVGPNVFVECEGLPRDPLEYLAEEQVNFCITITGTTAWTIPEAIYSPLPAIPITRQQLAIKLKEAIDQSLNGAECEVQRVGDFPFRLQ